MVKRTKSKPAAAPKKQAVEKDYTTYIDREPTNLAEHMSQWLKDKTGYEPGSAKEAAAFDMGVKLTCLLRPDHQRSPENQDRLATSRAINKPKPQDDADEEAPKPKRARKAPAARKRRAKAEPEATDDLDIEPEPADDVEPEDVDIEPEEDQG